MVALMLRYAESREEVAYQYARTLLGAFAADPHIEDALQLTHDLITESINDIRTFEGEEASKRINAALRQLLARAEADKAFMAELTRRPEWGY